ncbi:hypothetical protein SUGI_1025120 [Cryptomeria japonica]|nr:hypothetical protein SUGI_1025120 [Cryptomeria japonica]
MRRNTKQKSQRRTLKRKQNCVERNSIFQMASSINDLEQALVEKKEEVVELDQKKEEVDELDPEEDIYWKWLSLLLSMCSTLFFNIIVILLIVFHNVKDDHHPLQHQIACYMFMGGFFANLLAFYVHLCWPNKVHVYIQIVMFLIFYFGAYLLLDEAFGCDSVDCFSQGEG